MSESDRAPALRRLEQARHHEDVRAVVEQLVAGTLSREQAQAWARERYTYGMPLNGDTTGVLNALVALDEVDARGRPFVGEVELRSYLDVLRRGTPLGTPDPILALAFDIDALAARVGGQVEHWLETGLDWQAELQWATRASGRCYRARASARERKPVTVHRMHGVEPLVAIIDVFEDLALDERDVVLAPDFVPLLEQLPRWALWRVDDNANHFEIERSTSFAKLELHERTMRERGHRQFYWIDPAD